MSTASDLPRASGSPQVPPESRIERKRVRRMERILDVTAEVIGHQGTSRFSLEEVAERLDVTKGSLYHYFPSKDELLISAIETLARRIMVDLRAEVADETQTATETLRSLLAKQISVIVWDYPASVELFTLQEPADAAGRVKALRSEHDALFRSVIKEGIAAGEFRLVSTAASLECIYSAINMAPLWIRRGNHRVARRQMNELIGTLLMLVGVFPAEK